MELAVYHPNYTVSLSHNVSLGAAQSVYGIVGGAILMIGASAGHLSVRIWQRRILDTRYDPYNMALLTIPIVYQLTTYVVPLGGTFAVALVSTGVMCGESVCLYTTEKIFNYGYNMAREGINSAIKTASYLCQYFGAYFALDKKKQKYYI